MILLWMLAAALLASLVGLAALGAERVARTWRFPARDVWTVAIAIAVVLPIAVLVLPPAAAPTARVAPDPLAPQRLAAIVVRPDGAPAPMLARLATPAAVLWIGLSALVLGAVLRGARTLSRARRAWRPRDVDGTSVLVAPDVGPAVVGVRRPAIVLPEWTLGLDAPLRALVVRHESEHVRAGDPRHLAFGALGVVLMPWNPALWWMLRRQRTALEIDCDARVLAAHRDVPRYGLLLLAVAQHRATSLGTLVGAPALTESTSELSRRITAMRTPAPRRRALATALGSLGAALAVAGAVAACSASRDVVGPRNAVRAHLDTSSVRTLPTVVAEVPISGVRADSVAAMIPSRDGAILRTGFVSAERYRSVRAQADSLSLREVRVQGAPLPMKPSKVDGPYFEFQVEHPVLPAPGTRGPRYPEILKNAKIEGTVLAQFVVDTNGVVMPGSFKVLKSDHDLFTIATRDALYEMRFIPAQVGGKNVRQLVQQPFMFSLTK